MQRILDRLGADPEQETAAKLDAFAKILALIVGTELWTRAIPRWDTLDTQLIVTLALGSIFVLLAWTSRLRRLAWAGLAVVYVSLLWYEFPNSGNHAYLQFYLFAFLALLFTDEPDDRRLAIRAVQWMVCVVFAYSGIQKLVYGYYADAQFFAWQMDREHWRAAFAPFVGADELARLAALGGRPGDGPYTISSPIVVAASHVSYVVEFAVAPLLFAARTRTIAVAIAIGFIATVEVVARELFFGLLIVNCLLLFLPGAANRRAVVPAAVVMVALILSRLGVLPEALFH